MSLQPVEKELTLKDWIGILGAILGSFMAVLDIQITNSSLAEILGALSATYDEGAWVSTSYLAAEIVVIPLTGWLVKVFGLKRYLLTNTIIFLITSIACGFSESLNMLIFFRVIQGLSGGIFIPISFTILLIKMPKSKMAFGMALFSLTVTLAPSIGPTIGGYLTERFGWEWIFYINLFPGILMLLSTAFAIENQPMNLGLLKSGDWKGIIAIAIGLSSFTIFIEEGNRYDWFASDFITHLAITSAVAISFLIYNELVVKNPILMFSLFKYRNYSLGTICFCGLAIALYGSAFILPLYLSQVQGYSPTQIGEVIMWMGVPQLFIIAFIPKIMEYLRPQILVIFGLLMFALSSYINSFLDFNIGRDQLILSQVLRAIGQPFIITPLMSISTSEIPKELAGQASALYNMLRNLSGSIGISVLGVIVTNRQHVHNSYIGEAVSYYNPATIERLKTMTSYFIHKGFDASTAKLMALKSIQGVLSREGYILAYADAFIFIALSVFIGIFLIIFTKPIQSDLKNEGSH